MSPLDVSSSPNQRWLAKEFANSFEQNHRSIPHEVHAYVEFAKHLSETEGPEPDPAFRAALRHRLLHGLIEDQLVPESDQLAQRREGRARRGGGTHCFERAPREPWIAAASTVLMVCGGAIGIGHESSQAEPDDVLYPVKRLFESGEMALAGSPDGQARELMEQAGERLGEARELVRTDEIHAQQALPETIVDFNEATADAGDIVVEQSHTPSGDQVLVSEFQSFSSAARVVLDEIAASADQTTVALIDDARATLDSVDQQLPILDPALDDTVDDAATTLRNTVSVVEFSTSDKVSMAVATVRTTAGVSDTVQAATGRGEAPSVRDVAEDLTKAVNLDEATDPADISDKDLQVLEKVTSDGLMSAQPAS